jgi:hypothetical protein
LLCTSTVGILLCRDRNRIVAEYALRDIKKPVGVSTYLTEELPALLASSLPSTAQLDAELGNESAPGVRRH